MTKARTAVLAALETASEPLSATGVSDALAGLCDLATVYRALHWLEEHGSVESFALYCTEHPCTGTGSIANRAIASSIWEPANLANW